MATTQESYRLGSRLPRYTTKLTAFASGMYLTNQMMPEGYAKAMINYDIDDTGTCIRPRRGREKMQVINTDSDVLGPVSLTDYIYAYNKEETEVTEVKDLVMSYGIYTKLKDLVGTGMSDYDRPIYVSYMDKILDTNVYSLDENNQYIVVQPGEITETASKEFWAVDYNKDTENFDLINNEDIGYVTARTITNAYAFDKAIDTDIGRPVGCVLSNELIAFTGGKLQFKEYSANPERNELINFTNPVLTKFILSKKDEGYSIKRKTIDIRKLNPIEATTGGYNILSSTPYIFEDEQGGAINILGIIPYKDENATEPIFSPKIGEAIKLRIYYQYPTAEADIKYKIEILDLTNDKSEWEVLEDFKNSFKAGKPLYYGIVPKYSQFLFRVTLRTGDDTTTDVPYFRQITCGDSVYDSLQSKTFDLSTCKGMFSWKGCVGVYGVDNALDTIFFSAVEDPSYFPYPNNIMSFDNEILAVHNYLDNIIVVTVDSIWLVVAGTTLQASAQKRILTNIYIPEIDAINLTVLKDQIFFKTDTQFYVLKPNKYTSDATDLKNYINSTAIANYTKDFTVETVRLLNEVYPSLWQDETKKERTTIKFKDFKVFDTRSIIKDEEVHYIYKIEPMLENGKIYSKLDLHLVYNTLTRSWRMYFTPVGDANTNYNPVMYRSKQSGSFYEFFTHSKEAGSSIVISKQTYDIVDDNLTNDTWNLTKDYNNYPYLDTGNVALDDTFTKRFREVQFNLLNVGPLTINFFVNFKVDGADKVDATNYLMQHITDKEDVDYGKIYITPIEQENMSLYGLTSLAEDLTESDHWCLDLSKFPDLSVTTVRFELQGRGRRGSIQLLNTSLQRYELSELIWVYRLMNAR